MLKNRGKSKKKRKEKRKKEKRYLKVPLVLNIVKKEAERLQRQEEARKKSEELRLRLEERFLLIYSILKELVKEN